MKQLLTIGVVAGMGIAGILLYSRDPASGTWLMIMAGSLWAKG